MKKSISMIYYLTDPSIRQWILLVIFTLSWLNARITILRFDAATIWNHIFYLIVLSIFPVLFVNSFFFKERQFKWLGAVLFLLLTFVSLPVWLFGYLDMQQILTEGRDSSSYRINQINTDGNLVSIYHCGEGALGKNWILVRQEKRLFSQLLIVKDLYKEDHLENIDVRVVDVDTIEINAWNQRNYRREWTAFHLKKYVYL